MKNAICLLCLGLLFSGCKKNDLTDEIKIRKNDITGQRHSTVKTKKDNIEINSQEESNTLQIITSKDVRSHIGDSLIIRGYIADVYLSEKVSYLNFENKFPKNIFSCAVFAGKSDEFGDLSKYKGKNVEVTGKLTTFKNKPQVILNSKDQIKILN